MLKATWRRLGSSAWLSIGLLILVPALAEAQLFPNRTIRRERPSPAVENPFNAQIRRDYYGYFPTCWSKFPDGWACPCPNPELPNRAASFEKIKFNTTPPNVDAGPGRDEGDIPGEPGMNPRTGEEPQVPLPPPRSPFDIDPSAPKPPPPGGRPSAPPGTGGVPPTGLMEMPQLPATSPTARVESNLQPGSIELVSEATLASNATSARPDLGPLPSATTPSPFAPSNDNVVVESEPIANMPAPAAAQAPKRRSYLSSLFGRMSTRLR